MQIPIPPRPTDPAKFPEWEHAMALIGVTMEIGEWLKANPPQEMVSANGDVLHLLGRASSGGEDQDDNQNMIGGGSSRVDRRILDEGYPVASPTDASLEEHQSFQRKLGRRQSAMDHARFSKRMVRYLARHTPQEVTDADGNKFLALGRPTTDDDAESASSGSSDNNGTGLSEPPELPKPIFYPPAPQLPLDATIETWQDYSQGIQQWNFDCALTRASRAIHTYLSQNSPQQFTDALGNVFWILGRLVAKGIESLPENMAVFDCVYSKELGVRNYWASDGVTWWVGSSESVGNEATNWAKDIGYCFIYSRGEPSDSVRISLTYLVFEYQQGPSWPVQFGPPQLVGTLNIDDPVVKQSREVTVEMTVELRQDEFDNRVNYGTYWMGKYTLDTPNPKNYTETFPVARTEEEFNSYKSYSATYEIGKVSNLFPSGGVTVL
jgi:hypothetical protein